MTILILGSEGFIGSHLVQTFSKKYDIVGVDVLESPRQTYPYQKVSVLSPDFDDLLRNKKFDVCINASGSGNVFYSVQQPLSDFYFNTLSTIHILDGLRKYNKDCRYIHFSSAAVYGNPKSLPVKESDACHPVSPYGWHKYQSELICHEYSESFGLSCIILRPFSVYGPGLRKQLFWDVFQKSRSNNRINLWGTGTESRDFVYINDLVGAIDVLINQHKSQFEVYNIACGNEVSIKDVVYTFLSSIGVNIEVVFNQQTKSGDPLNWKADIDKLLATGFSPKVSLKEGVKQTAHWLLENESAKGNFRYS